MGVSLFKKINFSKQTLFKHMRAYLCNYLKMVVHHESLLISRYFKILSAHPETKYALIDGVYVLEHIEFF